jgi:transcriptional regulator with XRE-family HTH domain
MSKPLSTLQPPPNSIAERLQQALHKKGKRASPTELEREFNLRWRGEPVSVTTTRKWLLGLASPTLDKLRILALWLDVAEDWLRWGVDHEADAAASGLRRGNHISEATKIGSRLGAGSANGRSPEEASLIQDYRLLQIQDKAVVRAVVEVLLRERRMAAGRIKAGTAIDDGRRSYEV